MYTHTCVIEMASSSSSSSCKEQIKRGRRERIERERARNGFFKTTAKVGGMEESRDEKS